MGEERDEREQWAEREASQFDKTANAIEESAERWRSMILHPENLKMALTCVIKSETWKEAARSLRQPYQVRLERERKTRP